MDKNDILVNSVKSMWAVLKRDLYGTWHKASVNHLHRYVNEVTFRLDEESVKVGTMRRVEAFLDRAFKAHIDCKTLTV